MKWLLKEPLVHFLALGAALFAAFAVLGSREESPRDNEIVISEGAIEHFTALFVRTWQRPPTRQELDALIQEHVREEIAYREGLAMGLDRDDTVIRRRVRQKLEFLTEDLVEQVQPTDADLETFLQAYPEEFRGAGRLSFRHVFLNPEFRGERLAADADEIQESLNGDSTIDAGALGDRIMLEHAYADASPRDVEAIFGSEFSTAVIELEPGTWHGPIASSYGAHLVIVDARDDGSALTLADVRAEVLRAWKSERRNQLFAQFYDQLQSKYEIVVEWPRRDEERAPQ